MKIEQARLKHRSQIIDLIFKANEDESSAYKNVKLCRDTISQSLDICINGKHNLCLVLLDEGQVRGTLFATALQMWCSKQKEIADVFFYTAPEARGRGGLMLRKYVTWARTIPGVSRVHLGITSGIKDQARIEKLYTVLGAKKIGSSWLLES